MAPPEEVWSFCACQARAGGTRLGDAPSVPTVAVLEKRFAVEAAKSGPALSVQQKAAIFRRSDWEAGSFFPGSSAEKERESGEFRDVEESGKDFRVVESQKRGRVGEREESESVGDEERSGSSKPRSTVRIARDGSRD